MKMLGQHDPGIDVEWPQLTYAAHDGPQQIDALDKQWAMTGE